MHRSSLFCVKIIPSSRGFVNMNFAFSQKIIRYIFAFPRPHYARRQLQRKGGGRDVKNRSSKDRNQNQNSNQTQNQSGEQNRNERNDRSR